jgi:hypothetical protein
MQVCFVVVADGEVTWGSSIVFRGEFRYMGASTDYRTATRKTLIIIREVSMLEVTHTFAITHAPAYRRETQESYFTMVVTALLDC